MKYMIISCKLAVLLAPALGAVAQNDDGELTKTVNFVRDAPALRATISVDSTYHGYGIAVLADGNWIEKGKEIIQEYSHPDRLGNGGNSWVSGANLDAEHWVRIDWRKPVMVNQMEIWWTIPKWYPRAFRIESLQGGRWVSALEPEVWLAATDRRSVVTFEPVEANAIRILQHARGSDDRGLMAAQEVLALYREGVSPGLIGARVISAAEVRKLAPKPLVRNIARLHESCPGAGRAVACRQDDSAMELGALNDGDLTTAVELPHGVESFSLEWRIRHVVVGAAIIFSDSVPQPASLRLEVYDGEKWTPIEEGLTIERRPEERRLLYAFEPVATRAIRSRFLHNDQRISVTEMEVYRYLPPAKNVWPDRLVEENKLERQILAREEEPSFEALSLCALSMTPARALLGFKDTPHEIGVTWDGTLMGWDTLRFRFGKDGEALADYRDTVKRSLIDGWRPGVVVEGQIREMAVRQTAFLSYVGEDQSLPALFIRISLQNLSDKPITTSIQAEVKAKRGDALTFKQGCVLRGANVVLLSKSPCQAGDRPNVLRLDLTLEPKESLRADFVHPRAQASLGDSLNRYRETTYESALGSFKRYWDHLLAPTMKIELPEARLNRLYKAVLTQILINGDGDIMYYGSEPSVYAGGLYGVEEGFCMMALAFSGLYDDAQRYMDGTYLTPSFLKKVDAYKTYAHRHQQYRNGLQPHYAVSAYRFSRDDAWIRKHLPLLRDCAEWTISERRKTMKLEGGVKPLHWGLLPKWSYGGDIAALQCYPLYANLCCWRGLLDTAWLLAQLGESETAARYASEAREHRRIIENVIDSIYQKERQPPFLPLRVYGKDPVGNDYYQLFAGCTLDLQPFEVGGKRVRYITDFLEQRNRTFCLLPRFRRDVGPGGLDAIYGLGYILTKLHEDSIREFLLGFYAFLAFNMDHETFASRETNLIYASDLHARSKYKVPDMSDPVPCSSAVALHFMRNMLVTEEMAKPGQPSGDLLVLFGAPRRWFRDGESIHVHDAPTYYGKMSFEVVSTLKADRIEAHIVPPTGNPCRRIKLRLRHPKHRKIKSVIVNGKQWQDVDRERELILIPGESGPYQVVVVY